MKNIVLMGIKHCGKSTQARIISEKLSCSSFDTDAVIEECMKKTPREIFSEQGEDAFKAAEAYACRFLMEKLASGNGAAKGAVIATGGGICNNAEALEVLHKDSVFVFLVTEEKIAADRIVRECVTGENGRLSNLPAYIAKKNPRTLDDLRGIFHEFYEERVRIYSGIADVCVVMDRAPKNVNAEKIISALKKSGDV